MTAPASSRTYLNPTPRAQQNHKLITSRVRMTFRTGPSIIATISQSEKCTIPFFDQARLRRSSPQTSGHENRICPDHCNGSRASMKLDLRCITTDRAITRAEQIERYVRSEINLMDNESSLKSSDQLRDRIRDLQQLLAVAFQLVKPIVADAMDVKRHADSKIPTGPADATQAGLESLEIYETLYATRRPAAEFFRAGSHP